MSTANLDGADLAAVNLDGLIREDVLEQIFDISDIPLPLTDRIGSGSHGNEFAEWTADRLADPDLGNQVVDGVDAGADQSTTGIRMGNHSQISQKTLRVSTRATDSNTIGFQNTLAYQVMMRGNELRRDVEAIMLSNNGSVIDDGDTIAGQSAGLNSWIVGTDIFGNPTNSANRGATGADGGWLLVPTDSLVAPATLGTIRALSETDIRDVSQSVYELGGDPTILMSRPTVIRILSSYMFTTTAQVATLDRDRGEMGPAQAQGAVSVFIQDFGVITEMISNRLQQAMDAPSTELNDSLFVMDTSTLSQSFLTGYQVAPLAKTGTADNRQISGDWTFRVSNWESQGVVADIDATTPVVA